ncbi:hypothetical protein P154DRAFT_519929 [Amniculicola lignicola CBS 123094]|uniref:Mid2 domain-containing protein n=1 Tax=Amniculicola lignicola CBS 123094 TaxID=1392246 RepID=A0A6A5WSD4_9PLEO|nr:hypothetical protein P154DRAFT_519929 [Amniculicola lignicola CBS 123094]
MLSYSICAFLAPAVASAMAFPGAFPEPTLVVPERDGWSPAPTQGPKIGALELFRRASEDATCGYISGESAQSLTCNNSNFVCATNTYYGVHGCCDPAKISTCSIPTTCIASSDLAASCTDSACSTNSYITRCTDESQPYCYQWLYVYSTKTTMTEHGCAASAFTVTVQRLFTDGASGSSVSSLPSDIPVSYSYITVTAPNTPTTAQTSNNAQSAATTATSTSTNNESPSKKTPIGAIVGGVVGGVAVLGAIIGAIVFFLMRNRKEKQIAANAASGVSQPMMGGPAPGVTEYKPQGVGFGQPAWQEQKPGFAPSPNMGQPEMMYYNQGAGAGVVQPLVAEAGGTEIRQPTAAHGWPQGKPGNVYEAPG